MNAGVYSRALDARDARFDGIFFVGIITTRIYCRPVCPARVSHPSHRRFFESAAAAERAGFRPCLRCRPELAPGRALINAVSRLASTAAQRIAAGALNGRTVAQLARDLCVSERHLRRALERALGVSPVQLARTHRLLLAKQLLTDTTLSISRIAYAAGFQSLRRFNAVFREQYGMSPSALRKGARSSDVRRNGGAGAAAAEESDLFRLTLAYRAPLAWDALLALLARHATPGVEVVRGRRYGRTLRLAGRTGIILVEDAGGTKRRDGRVEKTHVNVDVSSSLLPVIMPLIARLRQLFDLDAEPAVVDACLVAGGLGQLVQLRPGVRMPGAVDGFEVGLRVLLCDPRGPSSTTSALSRRVVATLGEPIDAGVAELTHLAPSPERIADSGPSALARLGVPARRADAIVALACAVADGKVRLEPGSDPGQTRRALRGIPGISRHAATMIVMRALHWPDAFPAADRRLQRAAGASSAHALHTRARSWRPWRAYAAMCLWSAVEDRSALFQSQRHAHADGPSDQLTAAGDLNTSLDGS